MNASEYRKSRPGDRVITTRPVSSQLATLPAGSAGTIRHKFKGFEVEFDRCDGCGIVARMTRIPADAVDVASTS